MYITGFILDKSPDGKRIKLDDGKWYGAFAPTMIGSFGPGDSVGFDYADSAKLDSNGNPYRNIKGKVLSSASPRPPGAVLEGPATGPVYTGLRR